MTLTSFEEFKKLWKKIPQDRLEHVHFILLTKTKHPLIGIAWRNKDAWLNYHDIRYKGMGQGWNIGVVARPKGLMILDIDTDGRGQLKVSNEVLKAIIPTFTVRTRSGGLHYYFLNNGEWSNQRFVVDGKEVGELRADWQYVVSPGSWVEPAMYRVINDRPIVKFEGDITMYFEKRTSDKKDRIPKLHGKTGKPLSELPEKYKSEKVKALLRDIHVL